MCQHICMPPRFSWPSDCNWRMISSWDKCIFKKGAKRLGFCLFSLFYWPPEPWLDRLVFPDEDWVDEGERNGAASWTFNTWLWNVRSLIGNRTRTWCDVVSRCSPVLRIRISYVFYNYKTMFYNKIYRSVTKFIRKKVFTFKIYTLPFSGSVSKHVSFVDPTYDVYFKYLENRRDTVNF